MGFGLLGIYMDEKKYYYTETKTELLKEIKTFFNDKIFKDVPDHGFIFAGSKFYELTIELEDLYYGNLPEDTKELNTFLQLF